MNKKLLMPTIVCASYYALGILTSLWNHGSHETLLALYSNNAIGSIYCDRIVMCLGFFVDLYHIRQLHSISDYQTEQHMKYLWIATVCYFISKISKENGVLFHYLTHLYITILHVDLMQKYSYYYSVYPLTTFST